MRTTTVLMISAVVAMLGGSAGAETVRFDKSALRGTPEKPSGDPVFYWEEDRQAQRRAQGFAPSPALRPAAPGPAAPALSAAALTLVAIEPAPAPARPRLAVPPVSAPEATGADPRPGSWAQCNQGGALLTGQERCHGLGASILASAESSGGDRDRDAGPDAGPGGGASAGPGGAEAGGGSGGGASAGPGGAEAGGGSGAGASAGPGGAEAGPGGASAGR